jgi:uncharacterized protein
MALTTTSSGLQVDLANPDPASINLFDIARHLSKINRFTGASTLPFSVAQHSCLVANILLRLNTPQLALWGLLHDAHEAYTGDITGPARKVLGVNVGPMEALDHAIATALDVPYPNAHGLVLVDRADKQAFALEWRDLMPGMPPEGTLPCPFGFHGIKALPWIAAEEAFLKLFDKLCIAAGCGRTGI